MDSEKPSTRHFPGGIRDEPEERRRHDLRLDHLGAIEARSDTIGVFVMPPGTKTLTVTPVPLRSDGRDIAWFGDPRFTAVGAALS